MSDVISTAIAGGAAVTAVSALVFTIRTRRRVRSQLRAAQRSLAILANAEDGMRT